MAREILVPGAAALRHGEARVFRFDHRGETVEGFLLYVKTDTFEGHVAYRNRCAHVGYDLDMGEGEFWSERTQRIYCKTHGARFRPEDGVCDAGPCVGGRLEAYAVRLQGPHALVSVPD